MTVADRAERTLPFQQAALMRGDKPSPVQTPVVNPIKLFSAGAMFGRGLLLILGEMAQLMVAFALTLLAIACCVALALKAEAATHFMGDDFTAPRAVLSALGSLLLWSPTGLVLGLLFAIFGVKLLDLIVRVLRRRAQLAEIGYPAVIRPSASHDSEVENALPPPPPIRTKIASNRKSLLRRDAAKDTPVHIPPVATVIVQRSAPEADGQTTTALFASGPSSAIARNWWLPFRPNAAPRDDLSGG